MSSLYRCRINVGYKPAYREELILFNERQIQEAIIKLKWQPGIIDYNLEGAATAINFVNSLSQSKASITISDPYLTGPTWPILFDLASLYTLSGSSSANNILLPPCKPGEDPTSGKCAEYTEFDSSNLSAVDTGSIQGSNRFAYLLVSLWYDIKGSSFGTDYYFRVDGVSISHGSSYPNVTIRGIEPRSVTFNQDIANFGFEEGITLEEAIKKVAEDYNYQVDFCAPADAPPSIPRRIPRNVRLKGITADEAIKTVLKSTGGNMLSLPTKDFKNKISVCTRGELYQGCSVFYLGKGLYEGYEINGQIENSNFINNFENGSANANSADPWLSESFSERTYVIGELLSKTRQEALKKVRKVSFPNQFEAYTPRPTGALSSGKIWKGSGPEVKEEIVQNTNLYGVSPTGTRAISFLSGRVVEADSASGRVVIETDFSLQICQKRAEAKCFWRKIQQETVNLSSISVKTGEKVSISANLGASSAEKKEFTRFYIVGHNNSLVTLDPRIVWKYAIPNAEVQATLPRTPSIQTPGSTPIPQPATGDVVVGKVGSTGRSTGPHIHAQICKNTNCSGGAGGSEQLLDSLLNRYVKVNGKPLNSANFTRGQGYGAGRDHQGIDYPITSGAVISVTGGARVLDGRTGYQSGFGNNVLIQTPEGNLVLLAHLLDNSIPPNISGLSTRSDGGKTDSGFKPGPVPRGLTIETSFRGVPRALRIVPGRTVLSIVTNYDEWVNDNKAIFGPDPSIWIARRFSNWFVSEVEYKWREGDVRVSIEGVSAWGARQINVPTFNKYIQDMRSTGQFTDITSSYFDYIRSVGSLDWKLDDGSLSSQSICAEAQDLSRVLGESPEGVDPSGSGVAPTGGFPTVGCVYTGSAYNSSTVNAIINAAYAGGINTREGIAGVVGNAIIESRLDPRAVGDSGRSIGIFQWNGSRRSGLRGFGSETDLNTQMRWFVNELKTTEKSAVPAVNSSKSVAQATTEFRRIYERPSVPNDPGRISAAQTIFNGLKCPKP